MKYIGVTQKTAEWLLKNTQYLKAITDELPNLITVDALRDCILTVGALRVSAHQSAVLCLWNADYLSSSGHEEWGFMSLDEQNGILNMNDIYGEVIERCLFVINQRLQGLLLPDDRFIHRSLGENIHSCLAARGNKAWKHSIGYLEETVRLNEYEVRSLVCIGPWGGGIDGLKTITLEAGKHLRALLESANSLLVSSLRRPAVDSPAFRGLRDRFLPQSARRRDDEEPVCKVPELETCQALTPTAYYTADWDYGKWLEEKSPLTLPQRSIIESDVILRQPVRIMGAAGSGKTLTMQLLAMRQLLSSQAQGNPLRVLYVVHNTEMANTVHNRFLTLGGADFIDGPSQHLNINTLFGYCQEMLDLPIINIIDKDAYQTKAYQRDMVLQSTKEVIENHREEAEKSTLFSQLATRDELLVTFVDLICNEIGVTIKGRDLSHNKNRYVESEKPLSRFHGALSQAERRLVFDIFVHYHRNVFEEHEVLDSDDVALTLLGHLRTPLWDVKRRTVGFDFVFVDETQLFNENERSLFHFMTKGDKSHIPVVLALDAAQDIRGSVSSGFGTLGIENLSNQMLYSVHRCTKEILALAFFVIQRTVDLFSSEFPDFTADTVTLVPADHPLAAKPRLVVRSESPSLAKSVLREVRSLRKQKIRQIAVVVHAEKYWGEVQELLAKEAHELQLFIQSKRGEQMDWKQPIVVLTRPESVGGQEFDAVICVGLEKGLIPRHVSNHGGLSTALEQQALREMYLSFTRARYQLVLVNSRGSAPSPIIKRAISSRLID